MPAPNSAPEIIPGLAAIADRYDAVLCDVWGVVHNGQISFAGACDALIQFQERRGPVVLVTNAPRPADAVISQLRGLDVPDRAWSGLVTSGDVTRGELIARAPGPAWRIGPDRDLPFYDGIPLAFAGALEAAFISCTGLFDDEVESPEDYREPLAAAAARRIDLICANPDRVVQRGSVFVPCAGALADVYEDLGGPVIMAGKPYPPIYERALANVERLAGRPVDPRRVLAIGDGVLTDVKGAERMGLDCLFVTDGIHARETQGPDGLPDPAKLEDFLTRHETRAQFALADLGWGG